MVGDSPEIERRAALHGALADPARLRIVDALALGDASPSELAEAVGISSNLMAHHLGVLERAGLTTRHRSEGDGRRSYVRLAEVAFSGLCIPRHQAAPRVVFVCTGNSARSQLAAALWQQCSSIPATSGGTRPAAQISPDAVAAAQRHGLDLCASTPRHVSEVHHPGDLVITVCDRARECLEIPIDLHWSIASLGSARSHEAVDAVFEEIAQRVHTLAPHLNPPESSCPPSPV